MDDMTVLVAGANGNLGKRFARALHARGLRVRSGMRNPAKDDGSLSSLGEVVRVDLERPGVAAGRMRGRPGRPLRRPGWPRSDRRRAAKAT